MSSSAGYEFLKRFLHPNKKDATALASISLTSNNLQNLHPGHWLWSDQEWVKAKFSFIATLSLGSKHFCIIINIFDRCQRWIQIIQQSYPQPFFFYVEWFLFPTCTLNLNQETLNFFPDNQFFLKWLYFCTWQKYHISVLARKIFDLRLVKDERVAAGKMEQNMKASREENSLSQQKNLIAKKMRFSQQRALSWLAFVRKRGLIWSESIGSYDPTFFSTPTSYSINGLIY